jgi:hypothetical protein
MLDNKTIYTFEVVFNNGHKDKIHSTTENVNEDIAKIKLPRKAVASGVDQIKLLGIKELFDEAYSRGSDMAHAFMHKSRWR